MKILLVDDHPLILNGFQTVLKNHWPDSELTTAATLKTAHDAILAQRFDLAIVDINLPDGKAGELFSDPALAGNYPAYSLLLSGTSDRDDVLAALNQGATAYISKAVNFDDLLFALDALLKLEQESGPYWFDETERQFLPVKTVFPRGSVLSHREHEIYTLIRQGLSDKEIAFRLDRSIHTVRVQIRSIRRKKGETRRAASHNAA